MFQTIVNSLHVTTDTVLFEIFRFDSPTEQTAVRWTEKWFARSPYKAIRCEIWYNGQFQFVLECGRD